MLGKRKLHATISTKTLDIWKREFPRLVLIGKENDLLVFHYLGHETRE